MGETYSQILYLFSWESQYHKHSISATGYQSFTMKRKSYEVKKKIILLGNKQEGQFPTWQRWNNQLLAHFPQMRGKKRGDSLLAGSRGNYRFSPSWQEHEEVVLSSVSKNTDGYAAMFLQCCRFQVQPITSTVQGRVCNFASRSLFSLPMLLVPEIKELR